VADIVTRGLNRFFRNFFPKPIFPKVWKVWKKSLEKAWEKVWEQERTAKEHVSSPTIYPTLSELIFRADVRRYDHVAGYEDDSIKKKQSRRNILLGLYVTAQCRPRAACAGSCKHYAASEWPAPVAENQPPTMLW
jgi:hypothetical protein